MKQHITLDQLNELSDENKKKLRKWWKPQTGDVTTKGIWFNETDKRYEVVFHSGMNKAQQSYSGSTYHLYSDNPKDYDQPFACYASLTDKYSKWIREDTILPLLSIGQMIEFLDENIKYNASYIDDNYYDRVFYGLDKYKHDNTFDLGWKGELADALWEAVKEVLENVQ